MPRKQTTVRESDEDLARRAQQGCSASFEELVRRFQVPLLRFLRQRTNDEDAEDLVQDTFVRAYQQLHRYRTSWRFSTWVFTIARRLGINQQRRRRPAADTETIESVPADTPPPSQLAAEKDDRRHLWDVAAERLSEPQLTTVWLYYVEEMPVKEIARVQGRSRVSVKTMLFRARAKLLPALQDREPNGPAKGRNPRTKNSPCPTAAEVANG